MCVFCSSSNRLSDIYYDMGVNLGKELGERGYTLVWGGSNVGIMGRIAQSAKNHGSKLIGIIPQAIYDKGLAFLDADEIVITTDLRERKAKMEEKSDSFVALPGGFGTLEEIIEIVTLNQLKLVNKPIAFLNTDGYFDKLFDFVSHSISQNFVKESMDSLFLVTEDINEIFDYIENFDYSAIKRRETKW